MPSGLFISAAHKSSGKTTVAAGLCAAFAGRGYRVQPFKKGPDYIDPMWLGRAAGRACRNLDFHCMEQDEIITMFQRRAAGSDLALVEGNKGLFDGVDPEGGDCSAALARLLGLPVLLVVDAKGLTRGIAPLLQGYRSFEPDLEIAGVVLNNLAGVRHEGKLRAAIERYTDFKILGAIGRRPEMIIDERHLGLVPTNEMREADAVIARLSRVVEDEVDLDALAGLFAPLSPARPAENELPGPVGAPNLRIGLARDGAFGFYYPDDLEALARAGAELVPIDTLHDRHLPEIDGLFLGGGFPETHMRELSANTALRKGIRAAIETGLPTYAECGGFLYLAESLGWREDKQEMVGVIPAHAVMHERPVGHGYVRLEQTDQDPWPSPGEPMKISAHEFHYASIEGLPAGQTYAYRVMRGHGIDGIHDGLVMHNLLASFSHQRDVAGNRWARRFVDFVRRTKLTRAPSLGMPVPERVSSPPSAP